jgi:hypothetical protein
MVRSKRNRSGVFLSNNYMSRVLIWVLLSSGLLLSSFQCDKILPETPPVKMKLLASFCAFHIVEIQDAAYYNYGTNWTNSQGTAYKHVFAVVNHCDFVQSGVKVGDVFTAAITEKIEDSTCAVCLGFMETPPLQHAIKVYR